MVSVNNKLNRVQQYLLAEFKDDLCDAQFNELKSFVEKFTKENNNIKQPHKNNLVNDVFFNDALDHSSIKIANLFFKLAYNNPTHANVALWNKKEKEWRDYRISIKTMVFYNKEEIEKEIERIATEYKLVLENENEYLKSIV